MASVEICMNGNGELVTAHVDDLSDIFRDPGSFAWIDVGADEPESLRKLGAQLGIHQLAIESALDDQSRARVQLYDDLVFLEFFGLRRVDDELLADSIGLMAGAQYLITVRRHHAPDLEAIKTRWTNMRRNHFGIANGEGETGVQGASTAGTPPSVKLLYAILDELVDGYFIQVDWLGDLIEDLEERVIEEEMRSPQVEIQAIRTRLLRVRRLIAPEQEVLNTLLRRDVPIVPEGMIPYFADVHDHLLRIHDWMETYRDQLSSIVELQLSLQSNRLDRTMRTLTASSIILMTCSLIAGIYGMNFKHMPELDWREDTLRRYL